MGWCDGVCLPVYGMERMGMERYLIVMGFEFGRQAVSMAEVAFAVCYAGFRTRASWLLGGKGQISCYNRDFYSDVFSLFVPL